MKYAIFRHENALGNSAEHTIGLAKHLIRNNEIETAEIFVETEFQYYFALCIPGIKKEQVHMFENGIFNGFGLHNIEQMFKEKLNSSEKYHDIHMPSCYGHSNLATYPATWENLQDDPDITLEFPYKYYSNNHSFAKDCILMQIREPNTYWKRVDGANAEPERFVNPKTFFDIAEYFASKGHIVIRVGDEKQTPMPKHKNIIDFAMTKNRNMLDDLFLVDSSKVFLSCDSGIWPMAGGMKKNLVLSNVMSAVNKKAIVDWLPKQTSIIHFKEFIDGRRADNSKDQLISSIEHFL